MSRGPKNFRSSRGVRETRAILARGRKERSHWISARTMAASPALRLEWVLTIRISIDRILSFSAGL